MLHTFTDRVADILTSHATDTHAPWLVNSCAQPVGMTYKSPCSIVNLWNKTLSREAGQRRATDILVSFWPIDKQCNSKCYLCHETPMSFHFAKCFSSSTGFSTCGLPLGLAYALKPIARTARSESSAATAIILFLPVTRYPAAQYVLHPSICKVEPENPARLDWRGVRLLPCALPGASGCHVLCSPPKLMGDQTGQIGIHRRRR